MTLSYEQFVKSCNIFLEKSKKIEEDWIGLGDDKIEGQFYLVKRTTKSDILEKNENQDFVSDLDEVVLEGNDEAELKVERHEMITYEYHVLYSLSHSVPVLYINAWYSSGKPLKLEDIWSRITYQKSALLSKKWESLTQKEHPILGTPFFFLHPCLTSELMNKVSKSSDSSTENYISSWLSLFGPVVGLSLPLNYFTAEKL